MKKSKLIMVFCIVSFLNALGTIEEQALSISLPPTNATVIEEAIEIARLSFKRVEACDYEGAMVIILSGLEQYPCNFCLQAFLAMLLGDHSENFTGELKNKMAIKSKDFFNKLLNEVEDQPKFEIYRFKNEYFFRFAQYKEQYENGLKTIADAELTDESFSFHNLRSGYYYQGVGAANYAKQLFIEGAKSQALDYAQKALIAWAQHFTYDNSYYNSYVHYGLALGILGHEQEMMMALKRSAFLIKRPLDYHEFKEVIDFFKNVN